MDRYRISVSGDDLTFSAAHFLTFGGGASESLHGHDYRVSVRLTGRLDEHLMVHDFVDLRARLRRLVGELDHRVLLPERNPSLEVTERDGTVVAARDGHEYRFPAADVALLPVSNTTAEALAGHLAERLAEELGGASEELDEMLVEVEEAPGQAAAVVRAPGRSGRGGER